MLAQRLKGLRESVIREMTRLAITHTATGFSQGFPDFDPSREVVEAARQALPGGGNHYRITWGIPPLRQSIAAKMQRRYSLDFDPDRHVTVTCRVTEAIAATLMDLLYAGDEVIIIEPYHEGYGPAVIFAGGTPRCLELDAPSCSLDLDKLRAVFNSCTRANLINTPHNPTGHVFTRDELETVAHLCREFDAVAITDEIYEHIDERGAGTFRWRSLPGMAERTATIGVWERDLRRHRLAARLRMRPQPTQHGAAHCSRTSPLCAARTLTGGQLVARGLLDEYYSNWAVTIGLGAIK